MRDIGHQPVPNELAYEVWALPFLVVTCCPGGKDKPGCIAVAR